jgi:hypothetical protein
MYKIRNSKPLYAASNRFISKMYYVFNDPDFGRCYSAKRFEGDIIRIKISKPRGAPRYQGRRSYRKQPKRWMKFGWYAEYMKHEWGETRQHYGCRNWRIERIGR